MLLERRNGEHLIAGEEQARAEALQELKDILHLAATSTASLARGTAPTYVHLRDLLLRSSPPGALPGFLQQCLTIDRFCDFIHLYHPDPAKRVAFLDAAFQVAPAASRKRLFRDVFGESGL